MSTVEKERDYFSRMQQGDKCAFEYFFKTYVDMLYAYAMGFCRDQDVAEDLVQEAFVRFWTMREKLSYSESIYGYLQRTVRNICINQKVRERVEEKYRQAVLHSDEDEFCWEDDDELEELRRQLLEAIDAFFFMVLDLPARLCNKILHAFSFVFPMLFDKSRQLCNSGCLQLRFHFFDRIHPDPHSVFYGTNRSMIFAGHAY